MLHKKLAIFFLFAASLAKAQVQVELRSDLQEKLGKPLCQQSTPPEPRQLWEWAIYDAQIQAAWILADDAISPLDLEVAARQQAVDAQHSGYAFGLCSPRKAWVVSTHAPYPLFEKHADAITLSPAALHSRCSSFDLDAAAREGGLPRSLRKKSREWQNTWRINSHFLEAGTLSITCHPGNKGQRGPELWGLMPVGQWNFDEVPHFQESSSASLINWIQDVRKVHRLNSLQADKLVLGRFAQQLSGSSSIRHPRALLLKQAAELKKLKGKFLGENRVKGMDPRAMAWLLWHSPQHRRLLLHREANAIGYKMAQADPHSSKLFVMVIARL